MKITLIFVYDGEAAYLHNAWDEYTLDENGEGFEEDVGKARKMGEVRVATISISGGYKSIERMFEAPDLGSSALVHQPTSSEAR